MSKCKKCNVEIMDETDICPLCQNVLEESGEVYNTYPDARVHIRKLKLVSNISLMVVILVVISSIYLNYNYYDEVLWSLIVGCGIVCLYLTFQIIVIRSSELASKLISALFFWTMYTIIIDIVLGFQGWSVEYVLPGSVALAGIGTLVLMFVDLKNWQNYMMYQIIIILYSLLPLLLCFLGINKHLTLSGFAVALSLFLFLSTIIIGDRKATQELKRRFHI